MFVNDAVRASLPARRPLPSACAPARHNRGQSQLLYYYYHYRDYDDNYYVCSQVLKGYYEGRASSHSGSHSTGSDTLP